MAERDKLVDPTYAAEGGPEYLELLEEAERQGKCPFCSDELCKKNEILESTEAWRLIPNLWPYKNATHHLLIIPKRHIVHIGDLTGDDFTQVLELIKLARKRFDGLGAGGGLAVRFGTNSGVTIFHLHFHLIAPETDLKTGKVFPSRHVTFPIG